MIKSYRIILISIAIVALFHSAHAEETIKIAFNSGVTGFFARETVSLEKGIAMAQEKIKADGGITIGKKRYFLDIATMDNKSNPSEAARLALKAIVKMKVLAIFAPTESGQAIEVSQITNGLRIPIISPGAASPRITNNKPYSFRLSAGTELQAKSTIRFAKEKWNAKKAAVIYEETNLYGRELATGFKNQFEKEYGTGSIVAFEGFRKGDKNFTKQLKKVAQTKPDFIYNPTSGNYTTLIVNQAKELGITVPFTGADFWMGSGIVSSCGVKCKGFYFTLTFLADDAKGKGAKFVNEYKKRYNGILPEEPAALAYDAVMLLRQALESMDSLTGDVVKDRKELRNKIASIHNFDGVTGSISFHQSGEPELCVKIVRIEGDGTFSTYKEYCP